MKKTRYIDLSCMRKNRRFFNMKRLSLAVAAITLSACGQKQEEAYFVKDAIDCSAKTALSLEQCVKAYEQARKEAELTAPKYNSRGLCEVDFGDEGCYRQESTGFFMPFMAGFLVSSIIDNVTDRYRYNPGFHYRNPYSRERNRIMTADGYVLGNPGYSSYKVPSKAMKPKPKTTKTVSRGGFGSSAAAKSSWGGGKASGGWGG